MTLKELEDLLVKLSSCNDITINNPERITSDKLDKEILIRYGIQFEEEAEGLVIDLFDPKQPAKIFKHKCDAIGHLQIDDEQSNILILEGKIVHEGNSKIQNNFLENLFFSFKIQNLIQKKNIAQYNDTTEQRFIFLSPKLGKLEVGYKRKSPSFYDKEYHLQGIYQKLLTKNDQEEFWNFFRDNFIKVATEINDTETRFVETISKLQNIYDNASREFDEQQLKC